MSDLVHFSDARGRSHILIRPAYNAWLAAGSPIIEEAGRYEERQQYLYDGWKAGKPGFNPADNPKSTTQELAHVRFIAVDLTYKKDIHRMKSVGWVFPFSWEWWHARLPDPFNYPLIRQASGGNTTPLRKRSEMHLLRITDNADGNGRPGWWWIRERDGKIFLTLDATHAATWRATTPDERTVDRYQAETLYVALTAK